MAALKRRLNTDSDIHALHKELDEVSCPICLDRPHNAVLLLCSSNEKGCKSYICDTSYRHSNCLDQFKKSRGNSRSNATLQSSMPINLVSSSTTTDASMTLRTHAFDGNENHNLNEISNDTFVRLPEELVDSESVQERIEHEGVNANSPELSLSPGCPLCRGTILGWEVVDEARKYLNLKKRSCSRESCSFSGNYQELRRHARRVHPTIRPSDIDPSRERAWRCLEHQREYGDIVSAVHSAMPGAVVVGDYIIENGDRLSVERESRTNEVNAPWWTTFFFFQMIGSIDGAAEPRTWSRAWTRHRQSAETLADRRFLWGENLLGLHDNDADDDDDDDNGYLHVLGNAGEDASPIPRRRRRLTRSRSNDHS